MKTKDLREGKKNGPVKTYHHRPNLAKLYYVSSLNCVLTASKKDLPKIASNCLKITVKADQVPAFYELLASKYYNQALESEKIS